MDIKSPSTYAKFAYKQIRKYTSCIKKRKKNIYLFGSWFGEKYADNSRYFFEYVNNEHPDVDCIWIARSQQVVDEIKGKGYKAFLESSKEGHKYMRSAKYVFVSTGWRDIDESFVGGASIINFWHGVPLKKVMYDDQVFSPLNYRGKIMNVINRFPQRNEFVISTSKTISNIYLHAFRKDKRHIVLIGQPRNDIFYSGATGSLRERFYGRKIITYMPTHRQEGKVHLDCSKLFNLEKLNTLCKENNYEFIIKKHFYHSKEEIVSGYSNIIELTHENIDAQDLMLSTDILITDYSSCYIDYLLLNRPVIFYNFDMEDYLKNDRGMYFEYAKVTPGPVAKSFEEFYRELSTIVSSGEDNYSNLRSKVTDVFYDQRARQAVSPIIYQKIVEGRFG